LGSALIVAAVFIGWIYFAGGSGEPSTELTTPPLAAETSTTASGSTAPVEETVQSNAQAFVIDPAQSVASFEVDEILNGSPNRVVGTTSEVAGQFQFDATDLSTAQFSQIIINARTFETDSDRRNRAIRSPVILDSASDQFELITFEVTSVDGLSGSVEVGDTIEFTLTGDLSIKGTTNPVTLQVTATLSDANNIEGSAEATVIREDFGIGIPNVPSVAEVSEEALIRLEFVATSV
jgi:polyisoprenoid-binding protein YceI